MKKNLIPKESMYWVYMKKRDEILNQKDNSESSEEKKKLDERAFRYRNLAIQSRKKELEQEEDPLEKIFNIGFLIWLSLLFIYLLATFASFLRNLFQF